MTVWETYFRDKKRVGLKSWEKGEERPRFEKIACEPRLGAGTERQSQSTKIPVRGRKLEPVFGFERRRYVRVPKSPQGDGNRTPLLSLTQRDFAR